jgi:hypothetical protein
VHAGTPKTGTKALQTFLTRQSKKLAKQGILYLESGRHSERRKRLAISHSALAKSLSIRTGREAWKSLRAELERSTCHTNVISAESFWFSDPAELRAELPKSQPVRLVVYLRRQDHYLQSLWKQAVAGGRKHSFKEWRRKRPTRGDYVSTVEKWADLFGVESILIRPYEKEGKINTAEDFCEVLGLEGAFDTKNIGRNPSPRLELAHLLRAFNHLPLDADRLDRHQLFRAIVAKSETYIRSCDVLSYEESVTLMEEHAESNRILIEKYYHGAPIPLFPELSPFQPREIWGIDSEEFCQLTTDVLEVLIESATSGKLPAVGTVNLAGSVSEGGEDQTSDS